MLPCFTDRQNFIILRLFHEFRKTVIFDDGFHAVEGLKVHNNRLLLVFGIRDIFSGDCGHTCVIPVLNGRV